MNDLRLATESDLPALMALINRAFAVESFFKFSERLNPEQTRGYFQSGHFLVSSHKGEIIACIFVEVKGDRGYFGLLAVDPARQRTGLGARLVAAAEEFARERGALHMEMTIVNLREELPAFYEKLGYTVSGTEEIPPEVIGPLKQRCHFIRYTKPLGKARE
jgi:N-acetylglutamate synthase-like GNAT family acetyltransferase